MSRAFGQGFKSENKAKYYRHFYSIFAYCEEVITYDLEIENGIFMWKRPNNIRYADYTVVVAEIRRFA